MTSGSGLPVAGDAINGIGGTSCVSVFLSLFLLCPRCGGLKTGGRSRGALPFVLGGPKTEGKTPPQCVTQSSALHT